MPLINRLTEFGDFLRTRRERISPAAVGIKAGRRRRTSGLRREEVAELAGISTSWYTWLEQGRDVKPSCDVLNAIANALRLDTGERSYLIHLGRQNNGANLAAEEVPVLLDKMLQGYRWAAYLVGRRWDVLAWNAAACHVFVDFSTTPAGDRNLLRYIFLDPRLKWLLVDWQGYARRMLAQFRVNVARYAQDAHLAAMVASLRKTSREFDMWWGVHDVVSPHSDIVALRQRSGRAVLMEYASFQPDDIPGARLFLYTPLPSEPVTDTTATRLSGAASLLRTSDTLDKVQSR